MSDDNSFVVTLERLERYQFKTEFTGAQLPTLVVDEPPPLGTGSGPNPSRLLATAVGSCLSASLLFCLEKSRVAVRSVHTKVVGTLKRNERNRLRIGALDVAIVVETDNEDSKRLGRCIELFEDYCVVTASVRKGVDVTVTVSDGAGNQLLPAHSS
jgi:uncharacterized OsmC-like protein